ncbi:hypothetical protein PWT90_01143 [Aphanocladium album]|nr:hypothetical protein PWT90_01143 [Aphanocladium album]
MKLFGILSLAATASAHTLFTTLYVNGQNQGDGTCVRMPEDGATGTAPIYPITGDAMACGYGGHDPVAFVCPAPSGSKLTFEFRLWPDAEQPGALDPGHKGPCAVYVKRVDDMFADPAAGPGWFKIWEDGYDNKTQEWCTDRLIRHDGLLSVDLPTGLAPGYYLVRPEILALHWAYKGDPQFYLGCAQVFVQGGSPSTAAASAAIPEEFSVSIPGHVQADMPGLTFDIYKDPVPAYPIPGPRVYVPAAPKSAVPALKQVKLSKGAVPQSCLLKNANWCAQPVKRYGDMRGCWAGVKDCYDQSKRCWESAPASGSANCYTWSRYCSDMNDACEREEFDGPPAFEGKEKFATTPGEIPEPWNNHFAETGVEEKKKHDDSEEQQASTTSTTTTTTAAAKPPSTKTEATKGTETPAAGDEADKNGTVGHDGKKSSVVLEISTHGKCGPEFGQTCSGSVFGDCCSKSGECGRKARHCSCGCVSEYGACW